MYKRQLRISLTALLLGHSPRLTGIIVLSLGELAKLAVYTVIFSIFIRSLLSWISTGSQHPISQLLESLTDPILQPVRRALPTTGGVDLSPLLIFILIMLFLKLIIQPIIDAGRLML